MPRKDPLEHKEYDKEYHARNKGRWKKPPEYNREIMRKWRAENLQRSKENNKRAYLKSKEEMKMAWQTPEGKEHQRIMRLKRLEKIAGRPCPDQCEVCGNVELRIVFDHNHSTGKFRGWLCSPCNTALGHARDNPALLQKLIDYLMINEDHTPPLEKPIKIYELLKLKAGRKSNVPLQ